MFFLSSFFRIICSVFAVFLWMCTRAYAHALYTCHAHSWSHVHTCVLFCTWNSTLTRANQKLHSYEMGTCHTKSYVHAHTHTHTLLCTHTHTHGIKYTRNRAYTHTAHILTKITYTGEQIRNLSATQRHRKARDKPENVPRCDICSSTTLDDACRGTSIDISTIGA